MRMTLGEANFTVKDGMIIPDHPGYWSIADGESLVVLRGQAAEVESAQEGHI